MSTKVTKNGYQLARRGDGDNPIDVIADSITTLCAEFDNDPNNPLVMVRLRKEALQVIETDVPNPVTFTTLVTPSGAGTASPSTFTVEVGTEVIFEGSTADGFLFQGWYINNVLVSSDQLTSIKIPAPQISGQQIQIELRCVAAG